MLTVVEMLKIFVLRTCVSAYVANAPRVIFIPQGDNMFVFNLMVVGKNHKHKSIEDFVFVSPAPCYTAAKLSSLYRDAALKEKDRAADLLEIGDFCEELAKDLIGIAANMESPGAILNSIDGKNNSFIDILIENGQKIAISQYVVQQYLQVSTTKLETPGV